MDALDVGAVVHGGVLKLHVDALLLAGPLEHVKNTLTLVEGDLRGLQDPAVLRHQLHLLRVQPVHVVQDGGAGDGNGAGVGRVGDLHILGLHRQGFPLRHRVSEILILAGIRVNDHALGLGVRLVAGLHAGGGPAGEFRGGVQLFLRGHAALCPTRAALNALCRGFIIRGNQIRLRFLRGIFRFNALF